MFLVALLLLALVNSRAASAHDLGSRPPSCYVAPTEPLRQVLVSPPALEQLGGVPPAAIDWRNVNGTNYCTSSRNQHIPQYCGSCWAMASTSALSDRVRIARQAAFPDYLIAAQTAVHCLCRGCGGGYPSVVYEYIHENKIGTDTCQSYIAVGDGHDCQPAHRCMTCGFDGNCSVVDKFPKIGATEYGVVIGVDQMKAEIALRGPIACAIDCDPIYHWGFTKAAHDFDIFTAGVNKTVYDHVISVVGYGYDATAKLNYWIIRNSWGEYWGQNGFFRLEMGNNQLGIESMFCAWAVPDLSEL